ncbi:ABC-three component system middle component 2 [Sporolactobacillus sp. STCC-11]|uniref:ABC-three component system middle component 2 n=1 Tax=Sporolactobacillus caesalpiniae TaxID=3230362 RepID=UPI00339596B0
MKNKLYSRRNINVYNTPLEIGLRVLIILNELTEETIDLNRLVIYDYFINHSSDFDKTSKSLRPSIPQRFGELILKRKVIQEGIYLMYSRELLDIHYTLNGIYFKSNQLTKEFLKYFDSTYALELSRISKIVIGNFKNYSDDELNLYVNNNLSKWGTEFTKESLVRGWLSE